MFVLKEANYTQLKLGWLNKLGNSLGYSMKKTPTCVFSFVIAIPSFHLHSMQFLILNTYTSFKHPFKRPKPMPSQNDGFAMNASISSLSLIRHICIGPCVNTLITTIDNDRIKAFHRKLRYHFQLDMTGEYDAKMFSAALFILTIVRPASSKWSTGEVFWPYRTFSTTWTDVRRLTLWLFVNWILLANCSLLPRAQLNIAMINKMFTRLIPTFHNVCVMRVGYCDQTQWQYGFSHSNQPRQVIITSFCQDLSFAHIGNPLEMLCGQFLLFHSVSIQ